MNDATGELRADESALVQEIERVIAATAGRHPGVITEEVVAGLLAAHDLLPREAWHRERRRNHAERIRRFSHEVYRILEAGDALDPGREIAVRVAKAFIVTERSPASGP